MRYSVGINQALLDADGAKRGIPSFAGQSSAVEQRITLAENMAADYSRETLLHEVLHQCLRVVGRDPDADVKSGAEEIEELMIESLSGTLLAALNDNPELVAYLTAK